MIRLLVTFVLCACLGACASVGPGGGSRRHSLQAGAPGRVTLVDYRTSNRLTLVNEAHTDPSELYSEKRASASTKVTSNEVFEAMLGHFGEKGFWRASSPGYAPISGGESMRKAIEVETPEGVRYLALDLRDVKKNYETLLACSTAFIQIYNLTDQNQAVTNEGGKALFDEQQRQLNARAGIQKPGLGLR